MRRKLAGAAAGVALVAAALPAPASAATSIGQTGVPNASCGVADSYWAQVSTIGPPPYTVPAGGGVITSWAAQAGATVRFLVWRSTLSPNQFVLAARTAPAALSAATAIPQPARIPVVGFETIGLNLPAGGGNCLDSAHPLGNTTRYATPASEPPLDQPLTLNNELDGYRIMVSAVVEPDADRDGYGDETQDQCPTSIATQGPCAVTTTGPTGQRAAALKKCKKKKSRKARKRCRKRALLLPV